MTRLARAALLLALTTPCAGCYSTWDVGPRGLYQFHGFRAPERREIVADDSDVFVLDQETELSVYEGSALKVQQKLTWIDVAARADGGPASMRGLTVPRPGGATSGKSWWDSDGKVFVGAAAPFELRAATSVKAKRYSAGKTAALVVPLALVGTVPIVFGVMAAIFGRGFQ